MTETYPAVNIDGLNAALEIYLHAEDAEKRLREILDTIPSRRVVCQDGDGNCFTVETSYEPGTVRVVRGVVDLRS